MNKFFEFTSDVAMAILVGIFWMLIIAPIAFGIGFVVSLLIAL